MKEILQILDLKKVMEEIKEERNHHNVKWVGIDADGSVYMYRDEPTVSDLLWFTTHCHDDSRYLGEIDRFEKADIPGDCYYYIEERWEIETAKEEWLAEISEIKKAIEEQEKEEKEEREKEGMCKDNLVAVLGKSILANGDFRLIMTPNDRYSEIFIVEESEEEETFGLFARKIEVMEIEVDKEGGILKVVLEDRELDLEDEEETATIFVDEKDALDYIMKKVQEKINGLS